MAKLVMVQAGMKVVNVLKPHAKLVMGRELLKPSAGRLKGQGMDAEMDDEIIDDAFDPCDICNPDDMPDCNDCPHNLVKLTKKTIKKQKKM